MVGGASMEASWVANQDISRFPFDVGAEEPPAPLIIVADPMASNLLILSGIHCRPGEDPHRLIGPFSLFQSFRSGPASTMAGGHQRCRTSPWSSDGAAGTPCLGRPRPFQSLHTRNSSRESSPASTAKQQQSKHSNFGFLHMTPPAPSSVGVGGAQHFPEDSEKFCW